MTSQNTRGSSLPPPNGDENTQREQKSPKFGGPQVPMPSASSSSLRIGPANQAQNHGQPQSADLQKQFSNAPYDLLRTEKSFSKTTPHSRIPLRKENSQPKYSRRRSSLRNLSFFLGGIITLFGLGFALIAFLNPTHILRDKIVAEIKSKTGRDLIIAGPSSFALIPTLGFNLQNVSLSAPPGFSGSPLLTLKSLNVSLEFLPLFKQEIKIDRVVFLEPQFHFEIDKSGRKNWNFVTKTPEEDAPQTGPLSQNSNLTNLDEEAHPQTLEPFHPPLIDLESLSLAEVRVESGILYYEDLRTGRTEFFKDLNLVLRIPRISHTTHLSGRFLWQGERFDVSSQVNSIYNLINYDPAQVRAQIEGRHLTGLFEGTILSKEALETKGTLKIQAPSYTRLLALMQGQPLQTEINDPISLSGKVSSYANLLTLSLTSLSSEAFEGKGEISITTKEERPFISAELDFSYLDISQDPLRAQEETPSSRPSIKNLTPGDDDPSRLNFAKKFPPSASEDSLKRSERPFDLGALSHADLEANIAAKKVLIKGLKFGKSEFQLNLKNRILDTKLTQVELYEGTAKGLVTLNARDPKNPEIRGALEISNIQIQPFLRDVARTEWLVGRGSLKLDVSGKGPSEKAIINSLAGSANLHFQDGAIVGLNIAGLFRNVNKGSLGGLKTAPSEKTDFSELSSSWSIQNGLAHNEDLILLNPLLRITGSGNVLISERTLDYALRPKVVSDLTGQGGTVNLTGFEIPIWVHGSWDKPKFSPDLNAVLKDPNKAVETIKEIGKQFKGKKAADILKGLLGKANTPPPSENTTPNATSTETNPTNDATSSDKTSKTEQFLQKFLKPQP